MLLSVVLSLTEGLSISLVFPLIALLQNTDQFSQPHGHLGTLLIGLLRTTGLPQSAWLPGILILLVLAIGLLSQLDGILTALIVGVILRVRQNLSVRIFESVLSADWPFLARWRSSDLSHMLGGEMNRIAQLTGSLVNGVSNSLIAMLLLSVSIYLAPLLSLSVLLGFACLLPLQRKAARKIIASGKRSSAFHAEMAISTTERIQNLKVIKTYSSQAAELELFRSRSMAAIRETDESSWTRTSASRQFQIASQLFLCVIVVMGLRTFHLSPGAVLIFLFAFIRATPRLQLVQRNVQDVLADLPAFTGIESFIAECAAHAEHVETTATAPDLKQSLELRNITFTYLEDGPLILDDVSVSLAAGSFTAIAGVSGAGKSTMADIAMGLLPATRGEILVDGVAITRENERAWRRKVGYVTQDTLLFHDTVRANLLWASPDSSLKEIEAALLAARADFVHALPKGLDTLVGDRGLLLSHGQRQRLALARAFLTRPSLLILDEATNSLDLENEEAILRAVLGFPKSVTVLLISHRPSALQLAESIYVLEKGRLVTHGGWEDVRSIVIEEQPAS